MNKGMTLSWSSWVGLAAGLLGTAITNYVLILNRVTAVEMRAEYVAKDVEKGEQRAALARTEMLNAIATLRGDVLRGQNQEPYRVSYPAAAEPAPPAAAKAKD